MISKLTLLLMLPFFFLSCSKSELLPGQELKLDEYLISNNRKNKLILQIDGNLVLYGEDRKALWVSGTSGKPVTRCVMQQDGNLVLYSADDKVYWSSNTTNTPGAYLKVLDNGSFVIYKPMFTSDSK